jgi:diguanylate cyclase (GGDEF)-like protein/PAS domain S-box-containing protein
MTDPSSIPYELFRLIVARTANPFVVIGVDGEIRYASETVNRILGWENHELVGRNMADLLLPEDLERAAEAIAEIDAFDREGAGVPMVFGVQRGDGTVGWLEIGAMPMLGVPDIDAIVLRLRPCDAQQGYDRFLDALVADQPLDEVLTTLAWSITHSLDAQGTVVFHGFDGSAFASAAGVGVPLDVLALDHGPWCEAAATGEPAHRSVAKLDAAVSAAAGDLRACWTVPVQAEGVAAAALSVWRETPGPPLIGHRIQLERAARSVELALVRTAEHSRLRHLAGHDALTGVANRSQFRDRLASALAIGERDLAVAFCDLDGFKPVNDTFGHQAGDAVLVEVAERFQRLIRTGDELARVGGDEFTVLLRNVSDETAAHEVAERLHAAVRDPFTVAGAEVKLGVSVGVAMLSCGTTAETLLARADEALYAVKRAGGGATIVVA